MAADDRDNTDQPEYAPGTVAVFQVPDPAPIRPDGGSSHMIGVIVATHQHGGRTWVNLVAAHSTPEMASDHDVVVQGATPFPLVLMSECYAQAWADQIVRTLGTIPADALTASRRALADDGEAAVAYNSAHSPHGAMLPYTGPTDPRWAWVENWLPALVALSSPVRSVLLG